MSEEKPLIGPRVLLFGESGTGKTFSLGTLADWCQDNGKEMFVLFTENSLETLLGYWRDPRRGAQEPPPGLHWRQVQDRPVGLPQLVYAAGTVRKHPSQGLTHIAYPN